MGSVDKKNSENCTPEDMEALFAECGISLEQLQVHQFWRYYTLIRELNQEYGVTAMSDFETIVLKHFVDSVIIIRSTMLPSPLVDIGTGGGFPGIPLKIVCPELTLILAEKRKKLVRFLMKVCDVLQLDDVDIYPRNVGRGCDLRVSGAITRGVEPISNTLRRIYYFIPPAGKAVFMKGPSAEHEVSAALERFRRSYELVDDIDYTIPVIGHRRRLIVFERCGS
jgi:16S rRNA (guanine527-N7)-methyltransferase